MTDPTKTIIPPTVGRVVWYYPDPRSGESGFQPPFKGAPLAAIIACVHSATMVNLTVFDANGAPHSRTSVELVHDESELSNDLRPFCTWMPYQKGQAAKTEAAERRAAAVETKTYADGTVVTGTSPLPDLSPKTFSFGVALDLLKDGFRVSRVGWNGKGMWLDLQLPDAGSKMTLPYLYLSYPTIDVRTTPGARVPWLASQTDMLAEDWVQVP
ncbi:hypothetical protein ABIC63_002120 [Pseudacidovorax sp. 1753]|uniref:DUF2829 domain-containing protein n=1 Tax=Pseudacidovorax sp. 1753 TaxID=3156419 RepID=UPI003393BEFA